MTCKDITGRECSSEKFIIEYNLPNNKWAEVYCAKCFWHLTKAEEKRKIHTLAKNGKINIEEIENITAYDLELASKGHEAMRKYNATHKDAIAVKNKNSYLKRKSKNLYASQTKR